MADRPDARRISTPDAAAPAKDADGETADQDAYRDALECYADLVVGAADDRQAMRRLERRIADHLVDGAGPEAPAPPPPPPKI